MPNIVIEERDAPCSQFEGPISALMILLKHQRTLHDNFTDSGFFSSNNQIITSILDLLYNADNARLNQDVVAAIRNDDARDADLLATALTISSALTPEQKLKSIGYMNHWLACDTRFIERQINFDPRLQGIIEDNHPVISFYRNPHDILRNIAYIPHPHSPETIHHLGIYNQYQQYQTVYHAIYGDQVEPYAEEPQVEVKEALSNHITSRLSGTGILGWSYKAGERFTQNQLDKISALVLGELNVEAVESGVRGLPDSTQHARSLDQQIKSSISEYAKSDKTVRMKVKR